MFASDDVESLDHFDMTITLCSGNVHLKRRDWA